LIVDSGVLIAAFVPHEDTHDLVTRGINEHQRRNPLDPLVVSPLCVAELDHVISRRYGYKAALAALHALSSGAWEIPAVDHEDLAAIANIAEKYADQRIGATDASLVVLAHRYRTHTIATLDRRHFESMRAIDGKPFEIVPAP
jgi:predicted nucleic acid-binding protein